jgi:hypothetical protein
MYLQYVVSSLRHKTGIHPHAHISWMHQSLNSSRPIYWKLVGGERKYLERLGTVVENLDLNST